MHQGNTFKSGTLIIGLAHYAHIHIVENMTSSNTWAQGLQNFKLPQDKPVSLLTFVDGLAKNIERVTEEMYQLFGTSTTTIGCGAGSLDLIQKPCIISPQGLLEDATIIAAIESHCGVGVDHGWEILSNPLLVTEASRNCVSALNYQPALDVYVDIIESNNDFCFSEQSFFEFARTYPLGISSIDGELLVRDPIAISKQKGLLCVGEVPPNSTVFLLQGKPELLIAAAGNATKIAVDDFISTPRPNVTQLESALIFDCISRSLFLDQSFEQEIVEINSKLPNNCISVGALTLGEICTSQSGPIDLLNKSIVVAVF